jgi:two-component system sensor histidine kinase PilS (NtrC family)
MRFFVLTLLVVMIAALRRFTPVHIQVNLLIPLAAAWYFVGFACLALNKWAPRLPGLRYLGMTADLIMVTGLVYVTGGQESFFAPLFLLMVLLAAVLFPARGIYVVAGGGFVMLGSVVMLAYYGFLPRTAAIIPAPRALQSWLISYLVALYGVAYLCNLLARSLRNKGAELDLKREEIHDLKTLTDDILQSMRGGLLLADEQGRIRLVNRAGAEILGFSPDALRDRSLREILPQFWPKTGAASEAVLATRREIVLTAPGRSPRYLGLSSSALQNRAHGAGYVVNFQDLTAFKHLEQEVALKDRMSAVGRLSAGIAHEIRQPLTAMAGALKEFSRFASLDGDDSRLVEIVIRESQRLNQIIDDFLDYAREKTYEFTGEDMAALLEETLLVLERSSQSCRIVRNFPARRVYARVDRDRIKQVFWNLCNNAVRAMPDGGVLGVQLESSAGWTSIRFRDTGAGIDPGQESSIFEPFQSGFPNGTGLGLAIVYKIVQDHGGRIHVTSTPGEGAVFTVELPQSAAAPQPARAAPARARAVGR